MMVKRHRGLHRQGELNRLYLAGASEVNISARCRKGQLLPR